MRRVLPLSLALAVAFVVPAAAQVRVVSLDELRTALVPGDTVSIVQTTGETLAGRVQEVGADTLQIKTVVRTDPLGQDTPRVFDVPYATIGLLDRPAVPARNRAPLGAAIGAGIGVTMFILAYASDANEVDEWSGIYIGITAGLAGGGALIGWGLSRGSAKPALRFEGGPSAVTTFSVSPVVGRRNGVIARVTF